MHGPVSAKGNNTGKEHLKYNNKNQRNSVSTVNSVCECGAVMAVVLLSMDTMCVVILWISVLEGQIKTALYD